MSDASVTKWELPNLFTSRSQPARSAGVRAGNTQHSVLGAASDAEYQSGFEQGRREGLDAAQREIQTKLSALDAVLQSLSTPLAQADNQLARELIQLSVRLAEIIIHREVQAQPELVEKQVAEALATLSSQSADILIRLHPEDARMLEQRSGADAQSAEAAGRPYRIAPDPSLHRGGCILHTPTTLVDATIEKQLQDLLSEMLDSAAQQ